MKEASECGSPLPKESHHVRSLRLATFCQRLALHLLDGPPDEAAAFAEAVRALHGGV